MSGNAGKASFMALAEVRRRGIPMEKVATTLTREEQETCITFTHSVKVAEIATFDPRWMKAIEGGLAIPPREVYVYTKSTPIASVGSMKYRRLGCDLQFRSAKSAPRPVRSCRKYCLQTGQWRLNLDAIVQSITKLTGHLTPQDFLFANRVITALVQDGELPSL
ncbi:MAG: hypothetical protein IH860_07475 [Chloroflexi bacterium]|nr:hypothetical protein [Chloroflexota bacterium]